MIPESVNSIGDDVFPCCNIESISVDTGNRNYASVDGVLFDKDIKTLIQYPAGKNNIFYEIPNSVTSIEVGAFDHCSLESVIIGNNVTSIKDDAFSGSSLTSITIPDSVISIGTFAFYGSGLESAIIGKNVASIGDYAFKSCGALSQVYYLGTSDIANSDHVFNDCTSLNNVTVPNDYNGRYFCGKPVSNCLTTGTCGENAKWILNGDTKTLVICGTGKMTSGTWDKNSIKSVVIENGITSIGDEVFFSCSSLKSVVMGDNVDSIGNSAFSSCSALTSITIPDSVTSIGDNAFYCCSSLTNVTIPNSIISIGDEVFFSCSSLKSVIIGDNVSSIGNSAFSSCSALTSITIPTSVTSIGSGAFQNCEKLTSITIPNSVTSIGDSAFSGCSSLINVTIPASVASIGSSVLENCNKLESISVDADNLNYTSVDGVLFDKKIKTLIQYPIGNSSISYEIPNCVNSIENSAFSGCSSLRSVYL